MLNALLDRATAALIISSLALIGCGDVSVDPDAGSASYDAALPIDASPSAPLPDTLGPSERPASLVVPPAHDGATALPLLIALHGYTGSAAQMDLYLGLSRIAEEEGFYLVLPDGTRDASGAPFWNATDACCDFASSDVDDVAYIRSLMDELEALAPVDPARVYVMGHSNGGFMTYRLACELSERITAVASLAGSDYGNDTDCVPTRPVSVLQVHGTADTTVAYDGGSVGLAAFPSAPAVVERWAARAGCGAPSDRPAMDLERTLDGAETEVRAWTECSSGREMQLWTITGGSHVPNVQRTFTSDLVGWLLAH